MPFQPSLWGPEITAQDGEDAELAAAFHALPEGLRYDPAAVARLLGIVVRLASKHHLDELAVNHLATLNQMRQPSS